MLWLHYKGLLEKVACYWKKQQHILETSELLSLFIYTVVVYFKNTKNLWISLQYINHQTMCKQMMQELFWAFFGTIFVNLTTVKNRIF